MGGQQCVVFIGFGTVIDLKGRDQDKIIDDLWRAGLDLHYPSEGGTSNMFVTFKGKAIKFGVNETYGDFQTITNEKVSPTLAELENFRRTMVKYGVVTDPQLMVYSYND